MFLIYITTTLIDRSTHQVNAISPNVSSEPHASRELSGYQREFYNPSVLSLEPAI